MQVVAYLIEKRGHSLDFLLTLWPRGEGLGNLNTSYSYDGIALPTWMPDLSRSDIETTDLIPFKGEYRASGDATPQCCVDTDLAYFHTNALSCGTVMKCWLGFHEGDWWQIKKFFINDLDLDDARQSPVLALTGSNNIRKALFRSHMDLDREQKIKCIFRTDLGLAGFATDSVNIGDEAVTPFGFSSPWIIRPVKLDADERYGIYPRHVLMNQCYIEGVMSGELHSLLKAGKVASAAYTLR